MPFQARSKHKMTGGAERVTHIDSPEPLLVIQIQKALLEKTEQP